MASPEYQNVICTNKLGGWHIIYFGSDATSTFLKERYSSIKPKLRKAEPFAVILDHNRQKEIGVAEARTDVYPTLTYTMLLLASPYASIFSQTMHCLQL